MDPDGNGEVTLDEFREWWRENISAAASGSGAPDEVPAPFSLSENMRYLHVECVCKYLCI